MKLSNKKLKIILSDITELKQQGKTKDANKIINSLEEDEAKDLLKLIISSI